MNSKRSGVPPNSSAVIPRLVCRNPAAEIDFCVQTFGAEVLNRRPGPDGSVAHALVVITGEMVMIEAEWPQLPSRAPSLDGSSSVVIFVYVPHVDSTFARAVDAGAKVLLEPQDQFWGDRTAWIVDPEGHVWTIASRVEEPTEGQRQARWSSVLDQLKGSDS